MMDEMAEVARRRSGRIPPDAHHAARAGRRPLPVRLVPVCGSAERRCQGLRVGQATLEAGRRAGSLQTRLRRRDVAAPRRADGLSRGRRRLRRAARQPRTRRSSAPSSRSTSNGRRDDEDCAARQRIECRDCACASGRRNARLHEPRPDSRRWGDTDLAPSSDEWFGGRTITLQGAATAAQPTSSERICSSARPVC